MRRNLRLGFGLFAIGALVACADTLNPQPLPPLDVASNGTDAGAPTSSGGPFAGGFDSGDQTTDSPDDAGLPPNTPVDGGADADADDAMDAGDAAADGPN